MNKNDSAKVIKSAGPQYLRDELPDCVLGADPDELGPAEVSVGLVELSPSLLKVVTVAF